MKTNPLMTLMAAATLAGAVQIGTASAEKIAMETFGKLPDGKEAKVYTLTNKNGLRAKLSDLVPPWSRWKCRTRRASWPM